MPETISYVPDSEKSDITKFEIQEKGKFDPEYFKYIEEQKYQSKDDKTQEYWRAQSEKYKQAFSKEITNHEGLERARRGIVENGGKKYKEMWSEKQIAGYSLEEYMQKMQESSGHFATHAISRPDLFLKSLQRGYIRATGLEQKKPEGYRAAVSNATHFCVDKEYWGKTSQTGILCSVESLLENKAFMDSPINDMGQPNEDWPLSGIGNKTEDDSHKFGFNQTGIILIPKELTGNGNDLSLWLNLNFDIPDIGDAIKHIGYDQTAMQPTYSIDLEKIFNKIIASLDESRKPKRVFFYSGETFQDGIKELQEKYDIESNQSNITVSGKIEKAIDSQGKVFGGKGIGNFYAVR